MGGISADCTNVNVDTPWEVSRRIGENSNGKSRKYT